MNGRGEYGGAGALSCTWFIPVGAEPFDAGRAMQQIDAEVDAIVDALYRAMGVDPKVLRRPSVADDLWMQRVRAARTKAQQSPLWTYWETNVEPKYNDWRSAQQAFAAKPMTPEDYTVWLDRVRSVRANLAVKGVKVETPDPVSLAQVTSAQPAPSQSPFANIDTKRLLKWGAIGALAIGGLVAVSALASSTKKAREPYERYRYGRAYY